MNVLFDNFQTLINSNIRSISSLIEQVERLSEIINKENCEESKKELVSIKESIEKELENLLKDTGKLIQTYKDTVSK